MAFFLGFVRKFLMKRENEVDGKDAVEQADALFGSQQYEEVYQVLGESKLRSNIEVLWRLSRTLYKLSEQDCLPQVRDKYLREAQEVLEKALFLKEDDANVHKWMAVILSAQNRHQQKTTETIKNLHREKMHLLRSLELNPTDYSVLYLLGNWCFAVSSMTNLQRTLIRFLYTEPPTSSYQEAYNYFLKAEEIKGKFYIPNIYMLGKASYLMNQYYRARYYFDLAASLTPHTPFEEHCQQEAKEANAKLEMFNISGAVFNDFAG